MHKRYRGRDRGLIDEFFVMIRPMSGVMAIAEAMRGEPERSATR